MTGTLAARRVVTALGVVIVLSLAVGAIRVAAAWTASAAPLTVAPVSVIELQARLSDERARSAALAGQLEALDAQSRDLATALDEARGRIDADASHAADLDGQLGAAKARLAKVEAALARARQALRGTGTAATAPATVARQNGGHGEAEHEGAGHED
jgi:peptidoglycan hydrolase CwlO-like protein